VIGVNETVRGLKYSEMFELVFMAVEIQGNTFLNSTSDEDLKASSQLIQLSEASSYNANNTLLKRFKSYETSGLRYAPN
jgi:hypothetical protein